MTCDPWLNEPPLESAIGLSIRNDAAVPLFLSFHSCAFGRPYRIEALDGGAPGALESCESTCEIFFCPGTCFDTGVFMVAPGAVFPIGGWDGLVLEPDVVPAACSFDGTEFPCDVLRRASPGEYRLTVWYLDEVTGCDPDPCTCDLMGGDWCQFFPAVEVVGDRSASTVFMMPTAGPIEIGLSL